MARIAKEDVNIVVWWKEQNLLLSTEQMNKVGWTCGPYWKDGKPVDGPYPQMALWLTGFVR